MEEIQATKAEFRSQIAKALDDFGDTVLAEKNRRIEKRLFDFANFLEANIVLLYTHGDHQVQTSEIIQRSFQFGKILVLPAFKPDSREMVLLKIDHFPADLAVGRRGVLEPISSRCKQVPIELVDIAIVPGLVFDEKGGRIGTGLGYYDRFIPKLAITTRKVSLAYEAQLVPQVPMEPHDKFVDIIITEERVIYKI